MLSLRCSDGEAKVVTAALSTDQADVVDDVSHYLRLALVAAHHHSVLGTGSEALDVETELPIKVTLQSLSHSTHTACIDS